MLIDLTELILNWFFQRYFLSPYFLRQILTAATFCYLIYFQLLSNGLHKTVIFNKSAFANRKLFSPESLNIKKNLYLISNNIVFIIT